MNRDSTPDNLYGVVEPQRKDKRILDSELHLHLHPDLRANERVSIKKFTRGRFRRGLVESEKEFPYPVSPKIGPYEIKNPMFGAKNYYWCSCGMS